MNEVHLQTLTADPVIIHSRLMPPRMRPNRVQRVSLIDRLNRSTAEYRMSLIVAPAGFGKTTIAAEWAEQTRRQVAWVGISPAENRPGALLGSLYWSVSRLVPRLAARELELSTAFETEGALSVLASAINELLAVADPITIIVDDYQHLTSDDVRGLMWFLISHLPSNVSMILISREDPDLPLIRLRAQGDLYEIRDRDLRFSETECLEFFGRQEGLDLTRDDVSALHQQTEGWAVGLQLAAVAMQQAAGTGAQSGSLMLALGDASAAEYIIGEIVDRLSPELRAFVERLALVEPFTAELCDHLLQRNDSARILNELDRRNLFLVRMDPSGEWQRFHHLFARAVRDRFTATADRDELLVLHRRASEWFSEHGHQAEAYQHAVAAEDWAASLEYLEKIVDRMIRQNHLASIVEHVKMLPSHVVASSSVVSFWYAYALVRLGELGTVPEAMGQFLKAIQGSTDPVDSARSRFFEAVAVLLLEPEPPVDEVLAELEWIVDIPDSALSVAADFLAAGALEFTGATSAALDRIVKVMGRAERESVPWIRSESVPLLGRILERMGRVREADSVLRDSVDLALKGVEVQGPNILNRYAHVHLARGNVESAADFARQAVELAESQGAHMALPYCLLTLSTSKYLLGDIPAAQAAIQRMRAEAEERYTPRVARIADALDASCAATLGNVPEALSWLERWDPTSQGYMDEVSLLEWRTALRVMILSGQFDEGLEAAGRLRDRAEADGRLLDQLHFTVVQASIQFRRGNQAAAEALLYPALDTGAREGIVLPYLMDGGVLQGLLRQAMANGHHADYVSEILAKLRVAPGANTEDVVEQSLTRREVDVVRLVSMGNSNRDIAKTLFVSEWTVKKHLLGAMRKLGADNRLQAVEIARTLNLI